MLISGFSDIPGYNAHLESLSLNSPRISYGIELQKNIPCNEYYLYSMVNSMKSGPNSEHLRDAATLLLKGGTLINEPCPSCSGLQVRFKAENICVGGCQPHGSTYAQAQAFATSNSSIGTVKEMIEAIVKEKLVEVVQLLKQENNLSEQKIKAELIEIYLRIISCLSGDIQTDELKMS